MRGIAAIGGVDRRENLARAHRILGDLTRHRIFELVLEHGWTAPLDAQDRRPPRGGAAAGTAGDLLDLDLARELIRRWCYPLDPEAPLVGALGIEIEGFAIAASPAGEPTGRMPLPRVLAALAPLGVGQSDDPAAVPSVQLPDGGRLTVEPGAQIEHVTPPRGDVATVVGEAHRWHRALSDALEDAGGRYAPVGIDVWHRAEDVPQQLAAPRYPAMSRFFRSSGTGGHTMMCHTCSLQVNIDLGPPAVAAERWLVAHLISPLLTASFASSPQPDVTSGRALAWQRTDPTRTGFPRRLLADPEADPVETLLDAALAADVLLVRDARGGAQTGRPGWTFGRWLADGDPVHGRPRTADLAYHLTTLFHEVRLRGFLELRAIDALPPRWQAVPLVFVAGALYDDTARQAVRALMERHRPSLPDLWVRASVDGVADPAMCALAVEAWSLALAGASRLPAGYVPRDAFMETERFLDRFTLRGRAPADELREQLSRSPAAALAWAAEPAPSRAVKGRT